MQCRAARALLGWSAVDLAASASVGLMTVKRFEGGQSVNSESLEKLEKAMSAAGVAFIAAGSASATGGEGVRLSQR